MVEARYQQPVTSSEKFKFDFENLNVHQKALNFIDEIFTLLKLLPREYRFSVGDNLLRAALSISNNIAEGNDKKSGKERNRYFGTVSDSARECVSVLIVLNRQQLVEDSVYWKLKNQAREITSMIKGLLKLSF